MRLYLRKCAATAAVLASLILMGMGTRDVVSRIVFPDRPITFDALGLLEGKVEAAYIPTVIKSIQSGTVAMLNVTSNTATITSVVTANSLLFPQGQIATSGNSDGFWTIRLALTNATTITGTRYGNDAGQTHTVSFTVVELRPGVLKSNQSGTISLLNLASNTATITSVNTAKSVALLWGFDINNSGAGAINDHFPKLTLTNATTLTAAVQNLINAGYEVGYQVAEFN